LAKFLQRKIRKQSKKKGEDKNIWQEPDSREYPKKEQAKLKNKLKKKKCAW